MTTETHTPEILETSTTSVDPTVESTTSVAEDSMVLVPQNAKLPAVIEALNKVITKLNTKRDRGPDSTRTMTESDATRVILGDLKDASHTKAAETLGLSYGQIYSARKGFTFKPIYKAGQKS